MSSQVLYRQLLRIRRIEEAIAARYAAQQMRCPVHLSIGQEAVAVGSVPPLNGAIASSAITVHMHIIWPRVVMPWRCWPKFTACRMGVAVVWVAQCI